MIDSVGKRNLAQRLTGCHALQGFSAFAGPESGKTSHGSANARGGAFLVHLVGIVLIVRLCGLAANAINEGLNFVE